MGQKSEGNPYGFLGELGFRMAMKLTGSRSGSIIGKLELEVMQFTWVVPICSRKSTTFLLFATAVRGKVR